MEAFGQDNFTKQLDDLQSVIYWITTTKEFHNHADVQNVNLIGHSRGGGITAIKAEEEEKVKKLITWNGVSDFESRFPKGEELEKWKQNNYYFVENGRTKQQMPHHIQLFEDFQNNKERLTIQRAVKNLRKPFLIIHAEEDPTVSVKEAKTLHELNKRSKLFILPESNHVFKTKHPWEKDQLSEDLAEVVSKSISFLKT